MFPRYRDLRQLLKIWPGHPKKQVTGLRASLSKLWGTPQENLDWTDPSAWIPARLSGQDRALALAIWTGSSQTVNPRYTYGPWLLAQSYHLIAPDPAGVLQLTDRGRRFLAGGEAEAQIDASEGLLKILALVADNTPTQTAGIMAGWAEHLRRFSAMKSNASQKNALRDRLNNLADRGLIHKDGRVYTITDAGLAQLRQAHETPEPKLKEIKTLIRQQDTAARAQLKAKLLDMTPYAFEHLVKRLLEAMGYESVETTASSGDGGVDVIGEIEVGITSVKEVVQAKRHRRTIQRKDLDALRGSLHRFGAVRGTLICTSKFSSGTYKSSNETGAAPITLIDGDHLINLLIEHEIASQKIPLEVVTLDLQQLDNLENEL